MRDLRKYARQTNARLIAGGMGLVFTVGLGLIAVFYGPKAALTGVLCLSATAIPIALVILLLWLMEKFVAHANRDQDED